MSLYLFIFVTRVSYFMAPSKREIKVIVYIIEGDLSQALHLASSSWANWASKRQTHTLLRTSRYDWFKAQSSMETPNQPLPWPHVTGGGRKGRKNTLTFLHICGLSFSG